MVQSGYNLQLNYITRYLMYILIVPSCILTLIYFQRLTVYLGNYVTVFKCIYLLFLFFNFLYCIQIILYWLFLECLPALYLKIKLIVLNIKKYLFYWRLCVNLYSLDS